MAEKTLIGKVALVTGASRGIGRAIALRLGAAGAAVVVNYCQQAEEAAEVARQIIANGSRAVPVQADMGDLTGMEALFDRTLKEFGQLDILINNAGLAIYNPVAEFTEVDFDRLFAVNVKGLFFACQQAAQKMAESGRIINISSTVTKVMMPNYSVYAASKAAVDQITRVLAKELGPRGITVNSLSPGPTDTELFREGKSEEQISMLADMAALGRLGTPADIANAVVLLASAEAGWISGQNICANGGLAG